MINPQSRTNFHGPKDVRAIEGRLYLAQLLPQKVSLETLILFCIYVIFCYSDDDEDDEEIDNNTVIDVKDWLPIDLVCH